MTAKKQSTKKAATGKAADNNREGTPDKTALDYAQKAYKAALAHYEKTEGKANRFERELLVVDYDRDDPEAVALAVRVPGSFKDNCQLDAETFREWCRDTEFIVRVLAHANCPVALTQAIGVIYTDLLDDSDVTWTTPEVMRVMLPLALLNHYRNGKPGEADTTREILLTLCQELGSQAREDAIKTFTNK